MAKKKEQRERHGELDIRHIAKAPDLSGYEPEKTAGLVTVGHSESGAIHCIESTTAKIFRKKGADIAFLCLETDEELKHRGDRHETTTLKAGWHEVVTKRQANEDASWSPVVD